MSISKYFFSPELSCHLNTDSHAVNCMNPDKALLVDISENIANFIDLLFILIYEANFTGAIYINKGILSNRNITTD